MTAATVPRAPSTSAFTAGAAAMATMLVGLAPFGFVVGVAAGAGDTRSAGWAATWLIYSGSAHLAVLGSLADGQQLAAVVVAGLLVNVRLVAFSAAMSPMMRGHSRRFRAAAAVLLVDPLWALVTSRPQRHEFRGYYLGAGLVLWVGWAAAVTVGVLLGGHTTIGTSAAVGVPLCLLALVLPHARSAPGAACVGAGAAVGLLCSAWPSGTGVLVSMVAGTAAAAVVRGRTA